MTPLGWVAIAYGIVTATIGLYALRLRRSLRRQETGARSAAGTEQQDRIR